MSLLARFFSHRRFGEDVNDDEKVEVSSNYQQQQETGMQAVLAYIIAFILASLSSLLQVCWFLSYRQYCDNATSLVTRVWDSTTKTQKPAGHCPFFPFLPPPHPHLPLHPTHQHPSPSQPPATTQPNIIPKSRLLCFPRRCQSFIICWTACIVRPAPSKRTPISRPTPP